MCVEKKYIVICFLAILLWKMVSDVDYGFSFFDFNFIYSFLIKIWNALLSYSISFYLLYSLTIILCKDLYFNSSCCTCGLYYFLWYSNPSQQMN